MIKADAKNSVAKQTNYLLIPKVEKLLFLMRFYCHFVKEEMANAF
jgi:hypothetical protein